MQDCNAKPITQLLAAASAGDATAAERLWALVYDELHRVARAQLANDRRGRRLQPTTLVHEAYLRLVGSEGGNAWQNRRHFFAAAAQAMRCIRVDDARRRGRLKRGAGVAPVSIRQDPSEHDPDPAELLAVHEALTRLDQQDPDRAQVVLLRYFAGMTIAETATALNLAGRTVQEHWRLARAWLYRELAGVEVKPGPDAR